jgi:hypothetical protein
VSQFFSASATTTTAIKTFWENLLLLGFTCMLQYQGQEFKGADEKEEV